MLLKVWFWVRGSYHQHSTAIHNRKLIVMLNQEYALIRIRNEILLGLSSLVLFSHVYAVKAFIYSQKWTIDWERAQRQMLQAKTNNVIRNKLMPNTFWCKIRYKRRLLILWRGSDQFVQIRKKKSRYETTWQHSESQKNTQFMGKPLAYLLTN